MATKSKSTASRSVKKTDKPAKVSKKISSAPAKTTTKVTTIKAPVPETKATATKPVVKKESIFKRRVLKPKTALGALFGELVGVFILASVWLTSQGNALVLLFTVAALVVVGNSLSGSHFNPAITVSQWATRQITAIRMVGYIVAQVLGAMLALLVAGALVQYTGQQQPAIEANAAATYTTFKLAALNADIHWQIFFAQMLAALLLGYAFASVAKKADAAKGIGLGFAFVASLILAGSFAVVNPAVAVAVSAYALNDSWSIAIYAIAPIIGATIGALLFRLFKADVDAADEAVR